MALEGTIKTPFGPVSKKTAVIGGVGIAVVGGIVWYRQKQTADQPDAYEAEINPATGYPYGSAEDAAALAAQDGYQSPVITGPSGGGNPGGSGSSQTDTVVSTNAEWTQAVLAYVQDNGIMEDVAALSSAIGKYITGAYVNDTEVALINQAIAIKGQPPVAAVNGYPPNLNRTPPGSGGNTTPPPAGGGTTLPNGGKAGPVTGLRATSITKSSVMLTYNGAQNAITYRVYRGGNLIMTRQGPPFSVSGLKSKTKYTIGVQAVAKNGSLGPIANVTITTK